MSNFGSFLDPVTRSGGKFLLLSYYTWLDLLNESILQIISVIRGPQKSHYSNFWHNEQFGSFPDPVTKIVENVRLKRHPQIIHNISWEIQVMFLILCQDRLISVAMSNPCSSKMSKFCSEKDPGIKWNISELRNRIKIGLEALKRI